jgi:hypothetical protein
LIQAHWNAGEVNEAEAESAAAALRCKTSCLVVHRMALLTIAAAPIPAVASALTAASIRIPKREKDDLQRVKTAQALASRDASEIAHATRLHIKGVANDAATYRRNPLLAALAKLISSSSFSTHYFNSGRFAYSDRLPHTALTRYEVVDLFWPTMAPVWADRRFDVLAERIGLAAYWRDENASRLTGTGDRRRFAPFHHRFVTNHHFRIVAPPGFTGEPCA